jgi:hypothetical protein
MERSRSLRRMLGWSQGHKRKVQHVVLTEEGVSDTKIVEFKHNIQ